jgi:hypothetical protein
MSRPPRRPPPAPPDAPLHDEPLPTRPRPGAWPPGAPVPIADRKHRPRKLALALTRASGLAIAVAITAALLLVSPVGTRRGAHQLAARELATMLAPDERILAQTPVSMRRAADLWRRSYGVLAVTTRQLVLVGAAPVPLLRPIDPGPRELLLHRWPTGTDVTLDTEPIAGLGTLHVRAPAGARSFRAEEVSSALAVVAAARSPRPRDDERPEAAPPY